MNKYSYVTLLSDDSYLYGIILLSESLKEVKSQYPLEILVTPNISNAVLDILDQLNLKYTKVDLIKNNQFTNYNKKISQQFAKIWDTCFTKLQIWNMTYLDKVIYLDSDIMVLKNLDHLFNYPHMTSAIDGEYFNVWPKDPHFNAGILIVEPNYQEYENLLKYTQEFQIDQWGKNQCIADQELLNLYYSNWINQEELHLNKYYDVFAPYIQEEQIEDINSNAYFIHFVGRKPWRAFNKLAKETYTEKFYQDAFKIIQNKVNTLNWNHAISKLKLAIYGICKDEIINIEKYIKCFANADYICILDTGSTDGTWEYLQQAQKIYPNLIIDQKIINPWRYDEARNYSLSLVPDDTTIYFMMDLDEIIKEDNWVQIIKTNWNPLFSRGCYVYNRQVDKVSGAVIQQFNEYRIHSKIWHYKGVVHEQLVDPADSRTFYGDECIQVPIVVWHYPTNPNRESYIELCERGVKEEPLNWLMHLQLAAEYEVHFKYDKAIIEYRKIIAESIGLSEIEIGRCYASLGRALGCLEQYDEALNVLKKGTEVVPECGDCYFFAAEITYKLGRFKQTFELCDQGIKHCGENQWCTIITKDSHFPYLLMALSSFYMGNKILGLGYITIAKERNQNEETINIYNQMLNEINNRG